MRAWEVVVGIETHAQLATRSKMFSGASTAFGAAPNSNASAVDIALPGVLPVPNRAAVEHAIRFGLAVKGAINRRSIFARKNYFYPDLPKGYQISQYETPVVQGGEIRFYSNDVERVIKLTRAHLEEDAGKSLHGELSGMTGIDLNRAGTPLLEIVSEPELRGAKEAVAYARALHALVTWIGICDGNMQEGSFRCDANVSVRRTGDILGIRCEIKNLNSFRFMERAIDYEARRQIELLEEGGRVEQETRLYDPERDETRSMRTKEDAQDYRYFPDPDLLPLVVTEQELEVIRSSLPELPDSMRERFIKQYEFPAEMAYVLTSDRDRAEHFDTFWTALLKETENCDRTERVQAANWAMMEIGAELNRTGRSVSEFSPLDLAILVARIVDGTISHRMGKELFSAIAAGEGSPDAIIEKRGLRQISDASMMEKVVNDVLASNAKQVADYRAGKEKAFNSLVGQVMKATRGKANPAQVHEVLKRKLA